MTEAGEAQTQGLIASLPIGSKVERIEQYKGACAFCRKINGVVAEVVAADAPNKDPATQIWPGKNNIGRSASPRKRLDGKLVPREAEEMWQLPAGLAHPHCRGTWFKLPDPNPSHDPSFAAWLEQHLNG